MCKPRVLGYRNKTSRRQNQQARRSKIRSQVPLLLLSFEKSSQNLMKLKSLSWAPNFKLRHLQEAVGPNGSVSHWWQHLELLDISAS